MNESEGFYQIFKHYFIGNLDESSFAWTSRNDKQRVLVNMVLRSNAKKFDLHTMMIKKSWNESVVGGEFYLFLFCWRHTFGKPECSTPSHGSIATSKHIFKLHFGYML